MSTTPNYATIPGPSYVFGNSQDIHTALLESLTVETTDPANSNFALVNASAPQPIYTEQVCYGDQSFFGNLKTYAIPTEANHITNVSFVSSSVGGAVAGMVDTSTNGQTMNCSKNISKLYVFDELHINDTATGLFLHDAPIVASGTTVSSAEVGRLAGVTSNIQTQLNGKQATITDGSISDAKLASTFVKAGADFTSGSITLGSGETISGVSAATMAFVDATSSIQTQLNAKQATITDGSIADAKLASTFVKPSTSPILSGTNFTDIPTSAISLGPLVGTSISEKFTSQGNNGTANSYTLDYSANTAVYLLTTAPTANFTVRLNNCSTDTTRSINFAIIYATTGKYYCNSVSAYSDTSTAITLTSSIPLWAGGTAPSMATSTVITQTFCLVRGLGSNYCLSSVTNYV